MIKNFVLFLVLNFAALAIGGFFTGDGVPSEWYQTLNQAPWTPPGWVFGAAWTTIMICFAFYMAFLVKSKKIDMKKVLVIYGIQWVLNVIWNPIFFKWHLTVIGLCSISLLTLLVIYFLFRYQKILKAKSLLILPYAIWLVIATSLNAYIVINN